MYVKDIIGVDLWMNTDKRNGTKGQTTIYKTLHIKLKIETKRTPQKFTENSDATEG
jgi:hypothetical protein